MNTIINNLEKEIVINKSRFICLAYKLNNIDDVNSYLEQAKKKYRDATHYCYAYILNSFKKCSDDKEPSGTAGLPILNVLEKNDMNNILIIVVRYFGGIKLGAGGLVRAYTNSVVNCLNDNIRELKKGLKIELIFEYDKIKYIDNLFKDNIIKKNFDDKITYIIEIDYEDYNLIKEKLNNISTKIIDNNIIM